MKIYQERKRGCTLAVLLGLLSPFGANLAQADTCTLSSPVTWVDGNSNWSNRRAWGSGHVPNSGGTNVCISNGTSHVTLDTSASVASLQIGAGNSLNFNPGTSLFVYGSSVLNDGQIAVNGGDSKDTYLSTFNNVFLSGGGTVTLNTTASGGGNAYLDLGTNVDNTIQGEGIIGGYSSGLSNRAGGTINANSTGSPLINTLTLRDASISNAGLLEATNNGTLQLHDTSGGNYTTTVDNSGGGVIAANGPGASVQLNSTTIWGGTLNNNGGAFFGTVAGSNAELNGSWSDAVTLNGTYTTDYGASTFLYGAIQNNGNFQVNGGAGSDTYLTTGYLTNFNNFTYATLSGGGTVTLNTSAAGGGNAQLYNVINATLDNVDNTIQGEGIIYNNIATFNNHAGGTINANSTGSPLINTLTLQNGTFNNAGLLEATNNGTLQLRGTGYTTTVDNTGGGVIAANGPGASVQLNNTILKGGTLNNNGGAFFGTAAGSNADLYGNTAAGAVTLNGTYTTDYGALTFLYGAIQNNGNFQVNGGAGRDTYLINTSNVTLSGGGTVTLSPKDNNGFSYQGNAWLNNYSGATLDNVNNTIQGGGLISNNGSTIVNEAGGTILANSTDSLLTRGLFILDGTVTNNGTLQVNSGNYLVLARASLTNFSGNTLTGGSYIVNGPGRLIIDSLGSGGGEIVNNAAHITLNGQNSNIVDATRDDALTSLAANTTASSSLTLSGGRVLTTSGDFANAGTTTIGAGSTFSANSGAANYVQSGGTTQVDGMLQAAQTLIDGGLLKGTGTISGDLLNNGGTVHPGDSPGTLTITGNFTQTSGGLDIELAGLSLFSKLVVDGMATLGGALNVQLDAGFSLAAGQSFDILDFGQRYLASDFTSFSFNGAACSSGGTDIWNCANLGGLYFTEVFNSGSLELLVNGTLTQPPGLPEPGTLAIFAAGLPALRLARRRV